MAQPSFNRATRRRTKSQSRLQRRGPRHTLVRVWHRQQPPAIPNVSIAADAPLSAEWSGDHHRQRRRPIGRGGVGGAPEASTKQQLGAPLPRRALRRQQRWQMATAAVSELALCHPVTAASPTTSSDSCCPLPSAVVLNRQHFSRERPRAFSWLSVPTAAPAPSRHSHTAAAPSVSSAAFCYPVCCTGHVASDTRGQLAAAFS